MSRNEHFAAGSDRQSYVYKHHVGEYSGGLHNILAYQSGNEEEGHEVGQLQWQAEPHPYSTLRGRIEDVFVDPNHRGKGVAEGMWRTAHRIAAERGLDAPAHAEVRTAAGDAWAKKVGDYTPPEEIIPPYS